MWKDFIKDYLTFTRRERRGLFILLGIILLCMVTPLLFPYLVEKKEQDNAAFIKAVNSFMALQKKPEQQNTRIQKPIKLFPFDPNKISTIEWLRLGIPKKVATIILHYREAGGHFYKKEDLKKVYGLSDSAYLKLYPYIQIEQPEKQNFSNQKQVYSASRTSSPPVLKYSVQDNHYTQPTFIIDINKADCAAWSRLCSYRILLRHRQRYLLIY